MATVLQLLEQDSCRGNPEDAPEYPDHPCLKCKERGLYIWKVTGEEKQQILPNLFAVWNVVRVKCLHCGEDERHAKIIRFEDAEGNEIFLK